MNFNASTEQIGRKQTTNQSPTMSALQFKRRQTIDFKKKKIDQNRSFASGHTKPIVAFCNSSDLIHVSDLEREKENLSQFKPNTPRPPRMTQESEEKQPKKLQILAFRSHNTSPANPSRWKMENKQKDINKMNASMILQSTNYDNGSYSDLKRKIEEMDQTFKAVLSRTFELEGPARVNSSVQSKKQFEKIEPSETNYMQWSYIQNTKVSFCEPIYQSNDFNTKKVTHTRRLSHLSRYVGNQIVTPRLEEFKKGRLLGKGFFGQVYIVQHIESSFLCALKIIPKRLIRQNKIQEQVCRQLKLHSYLKHVNIAEQYCFFNDQQSLYILMELCPEGQLYNVMKKKKRVTQSTTAYLIKQICNGLEYLHSQHIIHRDLKPQNIILSNGVVKICDFGWAVNCSSGMRQTRCGTPLYLSPQMIQGDKYDESVDIWAVGVLTYELLVGKLPFRIRAGNELNKILSDKVEFPQYVELSETAKDFIQKILQKNPYQRVDIEDLLHHPFLRNADFSKQYYEEIGC